MTPYYQDDLVTLYHGDCREILPIPPALALVTDPPYGLGRRMHESRADKQHGAALAPSKNYGEVAWDDIPCDSRLLRRFVWGAEESVIWGGNFFSLPPSRCWLVWNKDNGSNDYADCELAWTSLNAPIRCLRHRWMGMLQEWPERRVHPTQKPLPVMEWALQFIRLELCVFDPFTGSGTTLVAAKNLGRRAIGIEIEERWCEVAARRLAQETLFTATAVMLDTHEQLTMLEEVPP